MGCTFRIIQNWDAPHSPYCTIKGTLIEWASESSIDPNVFHHHYLFLDFDVAHLK
jgi:hypothetical protein